MVVGCLIVVAVTEPSILRGTLRSPKALATVVALVVGLVLLGRLLAHLRVPAPLRRLATLVPLLVAGWVWVMPYYRDEVVDEALPAMAVLPMTTTTSTTTPPTTTPTTTGADGPGDTVPPTTTSTATPPTTAPPPAGPTVVAGGTFRGAGGHTGSGGAALYDVGGGQLVVRLEDVDIENTPGSFVHLVPGADRESVDGGVDLGDLTGNQGSSNYPVPSGTAVDPADGWTVVVWCRPFSVPVAVATLNPV